jgi:ABC-type glycerol-3-phosphate transport system substrate-binding protein
MKFAKVIVLGLVAAALSACSGSKPSTATSVPTTTGGYVQPAK